MPQNPTRCFVISPIGESGSPARLHADMVLESIIRAALPDMSVTRSDDFGAPEMITDKIIEAITTHELAIADLSFHNPNVFYELGLRHMAEKPVIHVCAQGTKLPFDTAGVTTIFFDIHDIHSHQQARMKIGEYARKVLKSDYKVSNPVTQARASIRLSESADSNEMLMAQLMARIDAIERNQVKPQLFNVLPDGTKITVPIREGGAVMDFVVAGKKLTRPADDEIPF